MEFAIPKNRINEAKSIDKDTNSKDGESQIYKRVRRKKNNCEPHKRERNRELSKDAGYFKDKRHSIDKYIKRRIKVTAWCCRKSR